MPQKKRQKQIQIRDKQINKKLLCNFAWKRPMEKLIAKIKPSAIKETQRR